MINNIILAYICNNLQNAADYEIKGSECYYKEEFIGEMKTEFKDGILNILFKPVAPVKYIQLNFTIGKTNL